MNLYKDEFIPSIIVLIFLFTAIITFFDCLSLYKSMSNSYLKNMALPLSGLVAVYLVGFRVPLNIILKESMVEVRCICWKYRFKMTDKFRVNLWGGNYHSVVFNKMSRFWIVGGRSCNKDFIRSLSSEMRKRVNNRCNDLPQSEDIKKEKR